jgi:hypothetical protein
MNKIIYALVVTGLLATVTFASAANVTTDKQDYVPGEIVLISGSGFNSGETVELAVANLTQPEDNGDEHTPWTVNADDEGNIAATWEVTPDELGMTLQLTATGLSSGLTAQHVFYDGNVNGVNVGPQTGTLVHGTVSTVTYTVSFTSQGNGSYLGLSVYGLPTGATYKLSATGGSGNPPASQTLTITNGANTPAGTYTFTVTNTSPSLSDTGTLVIGKAGSSVTVSSSSNPSGFNNSVSFTASLPAGATGNVTFTTNGTPFSTNAPTGGTAISAATSTLPRGTNIITARYIGDSNYLGSTNSLVIGQIVTNHPPVAGNITVNRSVKSIKLPFSDILTNATDVDGDILKISGVGISTNNVLVQTNATLFLYLNANAVNDQFTYTVSDGFGGSASGTIKVNYYPFAAGQLGTVTVNNGKAGLKIHGIPNYSYVVERTTNMVDWIPILTTNAASNGTIVFEDEFGDLPSPPASAYYRIKWVQ